MRCKVVSVSLGYNGHVFKEGEDVEVSTSAELERLSGYGFIKEYPAEMVGVPSLPIAEEVVKEKVEEVKTVEPPQPKQYGGKKKK